MEARTKKDFKLEWYSGSGAGGQHRNKHQNCCRITDLKTGLVANGTESKSRVTNQRVAFTNLIKRIQSMEYVTKERTSSGTEVIRNYHGVRNDVHDKASGEHFQYTDILDDITPALEARRQSKHVV